MFLAAFSLLEGNNVLEFHAASFFRKLLPVAGVYKGLPVLSGYLPLIPVNSISPPLFLISWIVKVAGVAKGTKNQVSVAVA